MNDNEITEINKQIRCVSHEIRNHLSICDMYARIIRKNLEKSNIQNPLIDNAIDCIQQSAQIIESNLLDLKSINGEEQKTADFSAIVTRGAELARAYIIDKDIELDCFIKNSACIKTDENRFLAVLVNIIKNGMEAIEIKGKIEVLAEVKDKTGIIKISNNGKPVPKDKREKIFTDGYTTKANGCGLGLSICRKYLAEQNATLELTGSSKTKTTFEIRIPVLSGLN